MVPTSMSDHKDSLNYFLAASPFL